MQTTADIRPYIHVSTPSGRSYRWLRRYENGATAACPACKPLFCAEPAAGDTDIPNDGPSEDRIIQRNAPLPPLLIGEQYDWNPDPQEAGQLWEVRRGCGGGGGGEGARPKRQQNTAP